jgi:hypothetical protein
MSTSGITVNSAPMEAVRRLPRIRAAMCTAIPPMSASSSSHSPVWMPMRIWMPRVSASARTASAQRMAGVGPSKVARWPSPVLLTTVPPNRSVRSAVISPKRCSTASPQNDATVGSIVNTGEERNSQHDMGVIIAAAVVAYRPSLIPVARHWADSAAGFPCGSAAQGVLR